MKARTVAAVALALSLIDFFAMQASAAPIEGHEIVRDPDVDRLGDRFFTQIQAGKVEPALAELTGNSSLWASKATEKQAIVTQIQGAIQVYGAVRSYELVQSTALGTTAMKRYYLVRHEKMVTRWELEFVRIGAGWSLGNIGFDDQVRNWF